ncbi:MAG: hypothetical protein LBM96_02730 [Methanobrevibacter sp.]|jgi:hypothetical protein|nr:hypothetical protein [Candidatus Methanoflexus mossambicus]
MGIYTKVGDTIKGDKILVEARKIAKVEVINKTGRHKAQKTVLKDNAICIIDKKMKIIN